jgi:hypothetical protein
MFRRRLPFAPREPLDRPAGCQAGGFTGAVESGISSTFIPPPRGLDDKT